MPHRVVGGRRAAARHRPLREAPVLQHAVIQHQRAGNREIQGEPRRDPHHVAAPREQGIGQAGALRPQHVGGVQRVAKGGQVHGVLQQLDADEDALARKLDRRHILEAPKRHVRRRVGGVGLPAGARIPAGADSETEGRPEGVRGPQQRADIGGLGDALDADPIVAPRRPGRMHRREVCVRHERRN